LLDIYQHRLSGRRFPEFMSCNYPGRIVIICLSPFVYPFFLTVEEYIPNISWEERFPAPVDQKDIANFLTHIFIGLSTLWKLQQAHRDLKPDNLLIKPDGNPVIIDLGIMKSLREDTIDLTIPGMMSPHTQRYASLEQLLNQQGNITYYPERLSDNIYNI